MPLANVAMSENSQFPAGGGEIQYHHQQQQHYAQSFPDERDEFIKWLRGEFAASNAIIDSLVQHLCAVGEQSEYDRVLGCIQQRRINWTPVLHMQQYFPVMDVNYALQQVAWRKQQQRYSDHGKNGEREFKRSGTMGIKQGQRGEPVKEVHNNVRGEKLEELKPVGDALKLDDKSLVAAVDAKVADDDAKPHAYTALKNPESSNGSTIKNTETSVEALSNGSTATSEEKDLHPNQTQIEKLNITCTPKTFSATESYDGKMVNVVDGLKLYEGLSDSKEVSKLVSLVNDMRVTGRNGQLPGQTYVASKRPAKGHGREMIQLGLPIADAPVEYETADEIPKNRRIEAIPTQFQDVIERIVGMNIITVKPDTCIIDFYNEGDHSLPHMFPTWFGRPVCILFLSECEMTFGRIIGSDHPGSFKGPFKLSVTPGSLIALQGKSANFAKHAINTVRKQRILVTFTKSQLKRSTSPQWAPPSNHFRHPGDSRHFTPAPSNGVLQVPPIPPQIPSTNGLFMTSSPILYPAPSTIPLGSTGWVAPWIPVSGTGVFLPYSSSGNLPSPPRLTATKTDTVFAMDALQKTNGSVNRSSASSLKVKLETKQDCNGTNAGAAAGKAEKQQSLENTENS